MSNDWDSWWYGGDRYDRQNRRAVEEVREQAFRAQSSLARQMRAEQGNLQAQIDRLTQAFVAMVEYEDVRGELNEHADAAACRRYAREVLPNIVVTGGTGLGDLPEPPEVHGYWLSAAARGLVRTASGGDGAADLHRAAQLDGPRTALLLVLVDAMRREPRFATGSLAATLPTGPEVTRAQRAVWLGLAEDRLGAGATAELEAHLASLVRTPDPARVEQWVRGLVGEQRAEEPASRASRTLQALAAALEATPSVDRAEAGDPDARSGTGRGEDPLADTLRSLVDEGAPGESEILARMGGIRERMGFVQEQADAPAWDAPVGDLLDLLLDDLGSTRPGARALALRLLGPSLPAAVETLRAEARVAPTPTVVRLRGVEVTVAADGTLTPDRATWQRQVQERAVAENTVAPLGRVTAIAAAVVGVLGLVLMVLDPTWVILGLFGLVGGAALGLRDRTLRASATRNREWAIGRADTEVERATQDQVTARRAASTAAIEVEDAVRRIGAVLARIATPTG